MPREIVIETNRDKTSSQVKKLTGKTETQSSRIQNETCPAPECNLSQKDVKLFLNRRYRK